MGGNDVLDRGEWRRGGTVVFASSIGVGATSGMLLLTAGLFVQPMRAEFGWSAGAATIAPIMILVVSFCFPLAGMAIDRWGSRTAAITGMLCMAFGLAGLAFIPGQRLVLYFAAALVAAVSSLCSSVTFSRGVATWFRRNIGLALGLTLSGSPIVSFFLLPSVASVIASRGWRAGYLMLAATVIVVGLLPVLLWFRERPASASRVTQPNLTGMLEGCSYRDALYDRRFWTLLIALTLASTALGGFLSNLQPILLTKGYAAQEAARLGMIYVASIMIGRIAGGFLLDRIAPRWVPTMLFLLAGVGSVLLSLSDARDGYFATLVAVALIGMGQGAEGDFSAFFAARLFGTRAYSSILGTLAMAIGLGMALGGMLFAVSFDATGSFGPAMMAAGCSFVLASLAMVSMPMHARL